MNQNPKNDLNIPVLDLPRIVVIGGGFAGLKFVKKLNTKKVQVVLIDRNNYHTFQPLMYQVATSGLEPDSIAYPLRKILKSKPHSHFRLADVQKIDTDAQQVETSIGPIEYDYLVVATGADNNFFGIENIEKLSYPMKNLIESLNLRSRILENFEFALNENDLTAQERLMSFVIVGGGPTGVELAGALAELKKQVLPHDYPDLDIRRMQINLIEAGEKLLPGMSSKASEKSFKFLKKMGVNVFLDTMVKAYDGQTIQTDKREFESSTLIWAAGVKGMPVKGLNPESQSGNRIKIDKFNLVEGYENIYALGDVAACSTEDNPKGLPMLASVAQQQGIQLAKNFNRKMNNKSLKPFKYSDKGTMATIGRNLAVVDIGKFRYSGLFAWLTWMFVHLMLLVDYRSRLVVFINWAWSYIKFDKGTRLIIRRK